MSDTTKPTCPHCGYLWHFCECPTPPSPAAKAIAAPLAKWDDADFDRGFNDYE